MVSVKSRDRKAETLIKLGFHLLSVAILALPFLVIGYLANQSLFISNHHAHLIEKALMVRDRGRVELIGFVYPPLPFFLLLPRPHPMLATALAALAGGATLWVLWHEVNRLPFPRLVQVLLLLLPMSAPGLLYLASQSMGDILALLLFLIAWKEYLAFTREGHTRSGFIAGLALGCAFFVNYYAVLYAIPYALLVPLFLKERRPSAAMAGAFVLFFPVLLAVGAWCYISWVFTSDPLRFLHDPGSCLFVYARPGGDMLPIGWPLALRAAIRDLFIAPLYLVTALVMAWKWPSRLPIFLIPLLLITAARAFGMLYPEHFAIGTYTVVALAAMNPRMSSRLWPVFLIAAALHLVVGSVIPPQGELAVWSQAIRTGQAAAKDYEEQTIGTYLAQMPQRSVLLDDRIAYRIVARAGTARPFLLPADALYPLAESQPVRFVSYVLVPAQPLASVGGRLASVYPTEPPLGFRLKTVWSNWLLYERETSSP